MVQIHPAVNVPVEVEVTWMKDNHLLNIMFAEEEWKSVWSNSLTVGPLHARYFKQIVYTCTPIVRPIERVGSESLILASTPVSQSIHIAISEFESLMLHVNAC